MNKDNEFCLKVAQVLDELRSRPSLEKQFNKLCEQKHLGLYLRKGRFYPASLGQSHTNNLVA